MTAAAPSQADFDNTSIIFDTLKQGQAVPRWQGEWSAACEIFWDGLRHGFEALPSHLQNFIDLVQDPERFSLARLVIPDLRNGNTALSSTSRAQQYTVLSATQELRQSTVRRETTVQEDIDDPEYAMEKVIQRDSDLHRARVLLHQSGAFGAVDEEEIESWLRSAPKAVTKDQAGP